MTVTAGKKTKKTHRRRLLWLNGASETGGHAVERVIAELISRIRYENLAAEVR